MLQCPIDGRYASGKLTVQFDITAGTSVTNVGIATAPFAFADEADCILRFLSDGTVEVSDGERHVSAASGILIQPDLPYHVRIVMNTIDRRFSIYITPPGCWREYIGCLDHRFRRLRPDNTIPDYVYLLSSGTEEFISNLSAKSFGLTTPVMFGTPEADAIAQGLAIFPPDSHWNTEITSLPVHPHSAAMIRSAGAKKHIDYNLDMNFIFVPPDQPLVTVEGVEYVSESDPGPFPIPRNAPVENWPLQRNEDTDGVPYPGESLEEYQEKGSGDRHILVIDPDSGMLHEFWRSYRIQNQWRAATAVTFCMRTNAPRPAGWTSADAAGLPIFPAVVRYDELAAGEIRHALRFTVKKTRNEYVYPASHFASLRSGTRFPRMGERYRLRSDFDDSGFSPHARTIVRALKRYGMFVADNGTDWLISISPDERIQGLDSLMEISGGDFEVVDTGGLPIPDGDTRYIPQAR